VGTPRGAGRSTEGALTGRKKCTETAKRSGLGKCLNPEHFAAVMCYFVHADGGKESVKKIIYCKKRQFQGMLKQSRTADRNTEQNNVASNLRV